jgi:hypothetical protein
MNYLEEYVGVVHSVSTYRERSLKYNILLDWHLPIKKELMMNKSAISGF